MRAKAFLFGMGLALLCGQVVNAQDNNRQRPRMNREEMQEMQLKRIVKDLKLDDETTAKFTPIYQEYQAAMAALQPQRPEGVNPENNEGDGSRRSRRNRPQLTDEQIDQMMAASFEQAKKLADIRETYYNKFRTVLSAEQARRVIEPAQQPGPQMQRRPQGGNFGPRGGGNFGPRGGGGFNGFGAEF